jgi:serine/threonine protein kinase
MSEVDDDRIFGETAVERGFITAEQLSRAIDLRAEKKSLAKLAEIFLELGFITAFQKKAIARFVPKKTEGKEEKLTPETVIGKTLGACKILERVGAGGMGTTYRGHHTRLDREVCVKLLHPRLTRIGGMAQRFQREARAAGSLSHPNVVQVLDFDQKGDLFFMIMEYVAGQNLKEVLKNSGPFRLSEAIWVVAEILKGLTAAHELGIVHRDMKPANILFNEETQRVYITDFGTVRILSSSTSDSLSTFGEILGTPQYMAPEQATADEVDGRTDLYGVGMLLFELLEGHPPFSGNSMVEVLEKQILRAMPPLSKKNGLLNDFVQKMCAKAMENRYLNAVEANRALDMLGRRLQRSQGSDLAPMPPPRRDPTRNPDNEETIVDSGSLVAIVGRLRAHGQAEDGRPGDEWLVENGDDSALEKKVSVEAPDLPGVATSAPGLLFRAGLSGFQDPDNEDLPVKENREKSHKDSSEILDLVQRGVLAEALPELLRDKSGRGLIPELLLLLWNNRQISQILELGPQLETALPTVPAIPFFSGLAFESQGNYERARSAFAVAVALDTSHVTAQLHLAECLIKLDRGREARRTLRRAALLNPSSVEAAVTYAEYLAGPADDLDGAIQAFEKSINLLPNKLELRRRLGELLCRSGRFRQAEAVAAEIDEWASSAGEATELWALIRSSRPRREKSQSGSRRKKARKRRAPASGEMEKAGQAVKDPRARASSIPPDIRARLELMRLAVASKKWDWVQDIYHKGTEFHPKVSQFHLAFGQAALALKQVGPGLKAFEKALVLKPGSRKAQAGIKAAKLMQARIEKSR